MLLHLVLHQINAFANIFSFSNLVCWLWYFNLNFPNFRILIKGFSNMYNWKNRVPYIISFKKLNLHFVIDSNRWKLFMEWNFIFVDKSVEMPFIIGKNIFHSIGDALALVIVLRYGEISTFLKCRSHFICYNPFDLPPIPSLFNKFYPFY